ncbi:MAG: putative quinol monooxygenase [Microbacteriaceae bacterium]
MSGHRYLSATIDALPGHEEAVCALLRDYARAVRTEPGSLRFEVHTIEGRTGAFAVYEQYCSSEAFEAHMGTAHCAEFNRALAPLVQGGASMLTLLTAIDV